MEQSATQYAVNQPTQRARRGRLTDVVRLFATPLRPSHYLALVNPLWTTHTLQARVEQVWDETRDARTLTLRPGRGWRPHRAGQCARIGVSIDGRRYTRTYSIASSPDAADGCVTITVKAIAGGRVSRHLSRAIEPGAYVSLNLPQGDFVLPDAMPVRPLFITAGSGITPVMSMLRTFVLRGTMPDATHMHYAPHAYDLIFAHELTRIAAEHPRYHLQPVYTRALGEQTSQQQHFTPEQLEALCPDWRSREVWACGPQALLDALAAHWTGAGLAHRLHIERFHAPLAPLPRDTAGGTVQFAVSQTRITADGSTPLLRVAEDAGLNPPHGCRMGICHSCDATLIAGCVRDLRTGALSHETGQKVQLCISAAAGDVALEL